MLVKGKYLEKTKNLIFFLLVLFFSNNLFALDIRSELIAYNKNLKGVSASFIQSDGDTVEEGIIYVGSKRIRLEYNKPQKISIVLSDKKGMYVNHELMEVQYFNTKKSIIKNFFKVLTGEEIDDGYEIKTKEGAIELINTFDIDGVFYKTHIIYERNPLSLRKLNIKENQKNTEIGFYSHQKVDDLNEGFFSLINPYLN